MVVGEGAVDFAEQLHHLAADVAQHLRRDHARDPVAAVDHHLERARQGHIVGDFAPVGGQHLAPPQPAGARAIGGIVRDDPLFERLYRLAEQGVAGEHHLQAVVGRGVVAGGHLHPGAAAGEIGGGGEIQRRGRRHADVDHIAAARQQAARERLGERGTGQAAIAPEHELPRPPPPRLSPQRPPDALDHLGGQIGLDHAADVVGFE